MVPSPAECCPVRHTATASLLQGDAVPTRAGYDVQTTQRPNNCRRGWSHARYARYGCGRCSRPPQSRRAGSRPSCPSGGRPIHARRWPAARQTSPPGSAHAIWTGQSADRTGHRSSSCAAEVAIRTRSGVRCGLMLCKSKKNIGADTRSATRPCRSGSPSGPPRSPLTHPTN